jgi:hypothetical protein
VFEETVSDPSELTSKLDRGRVKIARATRVGSCRAGYRIPSGFEGTSRRAADHLWAILYDPVTSRASAPTCVNPPEPERMNRPPALGEPRFCGGQGIVSEKI